MESYNLYKNYFDVNFCSNLVQNFKNYFVFAPRGEWNSWTINNDEYKKLLLDSIKNIVPSNLYSSWINVSVYNPGEQLKLHTDSRSEFTIVVNLNNDFKGGRFKLNKELLTLGIGDVVSFNGELIKHGVETVTEGTRYSLNYWFTNQPNRIKIEPENLI